MAITASIKNSDPVFRSDSVKSLFEDGIDFIDMTSTSTWNQGDELCYDTSTHKIRKVAATSDGATVLGLAVQAIVNGVVVGPYTGLATSASSALSAIQGPAYGVTALRTLKTGDAFVPGGKVYLADGGDTQTVSSTDPGDGNYIGLFDGPAVSSAAAGQQGTCKIGCRYPAATGAALLF